MPVSIITHINENAYELNIYAEILEKIFRYTLINQNSCLFQGTLYFPKNSKISTEICCPFLSEITELSNYFVSAGQKKRRAFQV